MAMTPLPQQAVPYAPPNAYTGGDALPQAFGETSNLRILSAPIQSFAYGVGKTSVRLPTIGYVKNLRVCFNGTLTYTPGAGSITLGDQRLILSELSYTLQGSNRIRLLDGIGENLIDGLDFQVLNNKSVFTAASGANPFYAEWTVELPVTEGNLLGVSYIGGGSTFATLDLTFAPVSAIAAVAGGATVSLAGSITVYMDWIDAEAPVAPQVVVVNQGTPNEQTQTIPGQGLWRETSQFIQTQVMSRVPIGAPNQQYSIDLPLGLPYLRIVVVVYNGAGTVDSGDTLVNQIMLRVQQASYLKIYDQNVLDQVYRQLYFKQRPGGEYVLTFVDATGSDRDILESRQLGRLELVVSTGSTTPPANSQYQVITQQLVPLPAPAAY